MPRQRSKKDSAGRAAEHDAIPKVDPGRDQSESDNADFDMMEKDSDEEELDDLVFGGGADFQAQLGIDADFNQEEESGEDGVVEEDFEGEVGLEDVNDAEVRFFIAFQGPS